MWGPNLLRGMIRCKYTTNISPSQEYEQENQNYDEIIEKFKPKKSTDNCYTPPVCVGGST